MIDRNMILECQYKWASPPLLSRLPHQRLSQRHIAWDTCALGHSPPIMKATWRTSRSRRLEIEGPQLLFVLLDVSNLRTPIILNSTMLSISSIFDCGTPKLWTLTPLETYSSPHHVESLYPSSLQDSNVSVPPKALFRSASPGSNSAQLSHHLDLEGIISSIFILGTHPFCPT